MKTKTENGIKLVEIKGSFLTRGYYPAYENEKESPFGMLAWLEPNSETVSFSHPGKLAIPLHSVKDIYNPKVCHFYSNLKCSEVEPLSWVYWATRRALPTGESKVFIGTDMDDNQEYTGSEALYALRRFTKGSLLERFEEWGWVRRLPVSTTINIAKRIVILSILVLSYKYTFNLSFVKNNNEIILLIIYLLLITSIMNFGTSLLINQLEIARSSKKLITLLLAGAVYISIALSLLGYVQYMLLYCSILLIFFIGLSIKYCFKFYNP